MATDKVKILRDKLNKVTSEKELLTCQLKNEKDEKELYKVHLKNTEIENTKLLTEVQTLKNLDLNKENVIAHYKDELGKLQLSLSEKEKLHKEVLQNSSEKEDVGFLKQQLRKFEDENQASRQKAVLMSNELSDAVTVRDKTMSDLHTARLETESVKKQLAEAFAQLSLRELQSQKSAFMDEKKEQVGENARVEQELRREIEDLKLRLEMAADHYKDKYKECQKLQKTVKKLTEQLKITESQQKNTNLYSYADTATPADIQQCTLPLSPLASDILPEFVVKEQMREVSKEVAEKAEKYRRCKQMLAEEKERCSAYADEVAKIEMKWREQIKVNEGMKLQLIAMEDQYKIQSAKKDDEISALSHNVDILLSEKKKLEKAIKALENNLEKLSERASSEQNLEGSTQDLPYFNTYCDEHRTAPVVPIQPPFLTFGNPYASQSSRDGADGAFNPDDIKGPPVRSASWGMEDNVVCSQPSRNQSLPDGLEDPDDNNADDDEKNNDVYFPDLPRINGQEDSGRFCFDSRFTMQKKCPLCAVVFPPNFDQIQFEAHVDSHWKVCPMCNEQFPLECDQQIFERHVQTHFDGNVLNFE
ncbi:tax1-binding protein 1 [Bombina bombina]|uniref:tax1-binding protein 1 n=1 Tax=Bombina bombina TaxID=8345 RepID=UPI00235B2348|nr:tax1-binding protein 1 [Bombina bombina]